MIFRLKTSKKTQKIFEELESRTNYKPYTLVKHAIAWSLNEGRNLSYEEFFPKYVKAHIDRGSELLIDMYNHAGSIDKYVLQILGVGDTV